MAKDEPKPADEAPAQPAGAEPLTNYQGQPANHETSVRDATDEEAPDEGAIAQVEEVQDAPAEGG